jgi:hypothetical protein
MHLCSAMLHLLDVGRTGRCVGLRRIRACSAVRRKRLGCFSLPLCLLEHSKPSLSLELGGVQTRAQSRQLLEVVGAEGRHAH